jgi:uncharacterized Zn-finger protein
VSDATPSSDAAAAAVVELGAGDLPAFCPNRKMTVWNQHPRVFLDVAHTGSARCPYCGTVYRLEPGTVVRGH